jgi:hydrogenase maturation protein HypF
MELEALYDHALAKNKKNPFKIILEEAGGKIILNPLPMFKEMVSGSLTRGQKATFFHDAVIEAAVAAAKKTGLKTVVLGGGCFQNKILLSGITKGLEKAGFKVYSAERAPLGDGGLALGQGAALISGIKGPEAP